MAPAVDVVDAMVATPPHQCGGGGLGNGGGGDVLRRERTEKVAHKLLDRRAVLGRATSCSLHDAAVQTRPLRWELEDAARIAAAEREIESKRRVSRSEPRADLGGRVSHQDVDDGPSTVRSSCGFCVVACMVLCSGLVMLHVTLLVCQKAGARFIDESPPPSQPPMCTLATAVTTATFAAATSTASFATATFTRRHPRRSAQATTAAAAPLPPPPCQDNHLLTTTATAAALPSTNPRAAATRRRSKPCQGLNQPKILRGPTEQYALRDGSDCSCAGRECRWREAMDRLVRKGLRLLVTAQRAKVSAWPLLGRDSSNHLASIYARMQLSTGQWNALVDNSKRQDGRRRLRAGHV